jgi:hypothetical protein
MEVRSMDAQAATHEQTAASRSATEGEPVDAVYVADRSSAVRGTVGV